MSRPRSLVQVGLGVAVAIVGVRPVRAMPNFARKYSMECAACHTTIPRLNEMGFQFRKAGFRMPSEIGESVKASMEDAFAARVQVRYDTKSHLEPGAGGADDVRTTSHQITLHEVTLYPLAMGFGKYYGSLTELSILHEEPIEIENAYFRFSTGKETGWFSGRAGIMHPFEGFGASDRPYSLARPFIQTKQASQNGGTFFTPWGFDEAGLEATYVHRRTSASVSLFNGLFVEEEDGVLKAFPAGGGNLQKTAGFSEKNAKDWQLLLNQILKEDGSGASFYFYTGSMNVPIDRAVAFTPANSFANRFYREAFYAAWRFLPKLEVQGAFQIGQDHFYDATAGNADDTFTSQGAFGEVDVALNEHVTLGGRYDFFDPSTDVDNNGQMGATLFASLPMNDGLQGIAEYQHLQQQQSGNDDKKDDNVQLRLIWIF
jgi:hypothetical protein